ncbi:class I SAM-dependent methyltransferase [Shewanella cyperi]|uniref:Class I SAM-dependent methyltransferase n=1 Tax=Shewanella cyperi TaxID=2814292 RepID=A0A975ALJ8_9GAMM|nr:methyltransferase domain-containing protein [Shewanella cyperi]QSX31527.1 class I SAM-dependent methyltransferase [Shewanella cyperi]QSX42307.1 class I SAM-dependent methyltransferase [Shewanella cyperi]
MKKTLLCGMLLSLCSLTAHADPAMEQALNNPLRSADNQARDQYRHPGETLGFFDVQAGKTVIELWPGSGWYAEILAPLLAKDGHYVAANFDTQPAKDNPAPAYRAKIGLAFEAWLDEHRSALGNASSLAFDPPFKSSLGNDNSADVVLTFRNLHNWAMQGQLETVFDSAYRVLKPGGVLGVVEHRAKPGMTMDSGYMDEAQMIAMAEKAGFTLAAKSEINANPKDSKDHPKGVWTLPPRLALGDTDKEKYLAIGESDRMTLKFVKPGA